jgi:glycosyltransferase involved in cell wall biosynthesis
LKISILTPDISNNCLGRAYFLAKALQKKYDIEIAGPIFGDNIWSPVANDNTIVYKTVHMGTGLKQICTLRDLYKRIDGDIIYASKPFLASFGIGLLKKLFAKKPLILDIDDWEIGLKKDNYQKNTFFGKIKNLKKSILKFYKTNQFWNILVPDKLVKYADKITVSNYFLKNKFGGTIIWHGRDESFFNPDNFPRTKIRKDYKISENHRIIMFLGTPRKHKGLSDLIEAVSLIKNSDIKLYIVGMDEKSSSMDLLQFAERKLPGRFKAYGVQPFSKIPEFLSFADIIVIPQQKTYYTSGQVPAKLFDAMAMAKPIIATNVSDLPIILNHCGLIIEPDNPVILSESINYLVSNPEKAVQLGQKARERFLDVYNWHRITEILFNIVEGIK